MKKTNFLFAMTIILSLTFETYAQNSREIIKIENKPIRVIEYHRFDGSVLEKYDESPAWVEVKPSPKPNPFLKLKKSRTIYEYTNFKGETFETYDFKSFRSKGLPEPTVQDVTVSLDESSSGLRFEVVPNPVEEEHVTLYITLNSKKNLTLFITNILGIEVAKIHLGSIEAGTHMKKINIKLIPGFYRLILTDFIDTFERLVFVK